MSEDKPEIKPDFGKPESAPEVNKPEIKPEVNKPEIKPEFSNPEFKSEFSNPEIKPQVKPKIKPTPKIKFRKERQSQKLNSKLKFLLIISILGLGIYFGAKPLIESTAKFMIRRIFVNSTVSIGSLSINPINQIRFLDISIKNGQTYDLVIKEASLDFAWPALFKKIMPELSLKDIKFTANSSQVNLNDLMKSIKLTPSKKILVQRSSGQAKNKAQAQVRKPFAIISKLNIPDLDFYLDIKDVKTKGLISFSVNLQEQEISFLNLAARQLRVGKIYLGDIELNALQGQRNGTLKIKQAKFSNLKIKDLQSAAVLEGMILSLDDISGVFLSKMISGEMTLNLWPILECTANTKVVGFLISDLAKDLGWENKIRVSGKLYAKAIFRSEGKAMAMLSVNFISPPAAAAALTISDPATLEAISKQNKLALATVRESFSGYYFEKGKLTASLLDKILNLEIVLDGQQGRRNLKFDLKDINLFGLN